jgi:lipopolysaccharide transport system permease protein|tara:strand:+ start:185 stop:997 length:813 start_codon:yes stop_codon:yes gene_type:complete
MLFRKFFYVFHEKIRDTEYFENYFFLFSLLLSKELKVRYKSTALGYLWALANPLLFVLVYYFAFRIIMRIGVEDYASFLLTGLFPWLLIQNSINGAGFSLINNASFIKNLSNKRSLFPVVWVTTELIHLIVSLPILFLLISIDRWELVSFNIFDLALVIIVTYLFALPIVIGLSVIACFLRDIQYLAAIFLQLFFWLTPIVYPVEIVPEPYRVWFSINPVAMIIGEWRNVFFGTNLDNMVITYLLVISFVLMLVALKAWKKAVATISDVL